MTLLSIFEPLSQWAPIVLVRDSKFGMPAVQSVHLIGLTIFLATLVTLDLKLAGLGRSDWSTKWLARQLRPWMVISVTTVLVSGFFIFLATPRKYLGSYPFGIKMSALCLAILFHLVVLPRYVRADPGSRSQWVNATVACVSLTLWFTVGWAGRAIAFVP